MLATGVRLTAVTGTSRRPVTTAPDRVTANTTTLRLPGSVMLLTVLVGSMAKA